MLETNTTRFAARTCSKSRLPVGRVALLLALVVQAPRVARADDVPEPTAPAAEAPAAAPTEAGTPTGRGNWVIPPGQERFVVAMVGGSGAIAGCRYASASIARDHVDVTFQCEGSASLGVAMRHPVAGACAGTCTQKFELVATSGTAPPGFFDALRASVSAHEREFSWMTPRPSSHAPSVGERLKSRSLSIAGGVLVVVALVLVVLQRRRDASKAVPAPSEGAEPSSES